MNKTGFENLRVYKLAEEIADLIWEIVSKWDYFAKDTVVICYPLHIIGVVAFGGTWIIHAFLGTFANPGTIEAMLSGKCTRAWAKLQHGKWLKEIDK